MEVRREGKGEGRPKEDDDRPADFVLDDDGAIHNVRKPAGGRLKAELHTMKRSGLKPELRTSINAFVGGLKRV